jgi:hypothetical protein
MMGDYEYEFLKINCENKNFPLKIQILKLTDKIYLNISFTEMFPKRDKGLHRYCLEINKENVWKIDKPESKNKEDY